MMQAIFGNLSDDSGSMRIAGKEVRINSPLDAMKHGIGFITEDRKVEGLMLEESIEKYIALANLSRISSHSFVNQKKLLLMQ